MYNRRYDVVLPVLLGGAVPVALGPYTIGNILDSITRWKDPTFTHFHLEVLEEGVDT